jgi:hypothetical protein
MNQKINFGEIWLADLSPKIGTELGKLRPVGSSAFLMGIDSKIHKV